MFWRVNAWKKYAFFNHHDLWVLYIISLSDWDDFANLIIISHFFFISEARKGQEGKLFVIYDNES